MQQYRLTAGSRIGPDDNGKYVLWLDAITEIFKKGKEYQTELVDKAQKLTEQDEALAAKEKTIIDLRSKVAAQELRADNWMKIAKDTFVRLTRMRATTIGRKDEKIEELTKTLGQRDEKIRELNDLSFTGSRQQRETIQDLVERGMIGDEHSRRLIQEATSKGQETDRLAYRLTEKDKEIQDLEKEVKEKDNEISNLLHRVMRCPNHE